MARGARLLAATTATALAAALPIPGTGAGPVRGSDHLLSRGEALATGCTPCHQDASSTIPALGGQSGAELRAKLDAFRDGTRGGTVMPQLLRGYAPAELDALAAWFARRDERDRARPPFGPPGAAPSGRGGR